MSARIGTHEVYRRSKGNPRKPQPPEIDDSLPRFIDQCRSGHLRRPGKPKVQRYGNLIWLALMPLGDYATDSDIGAGSMLYCFRPVGRRPKGALTVALDGAR